MKLFSGICLLLVLLVSFGQPGSKMKKSSLRRSKRNHISCLPDTMVRYRLTVQTFWTKQAFPKMFPTYRPHAQWSALVGRTHGQEFAMWTEGKNATLGVKLFAEEGDSSTLDTEAVQGYVDVLDTFVAPPITKSVGQTSAVMILDGRHSKLSFMMKIIPSPDWFIGVSGLNLCANGRWRKNVHIELQPMDGGTDQGLTFTAPNWPNEPAIPISSITSLLPNHPASSFHYPELEKLPRLAHMDLDLVSMFKHRRTFLEIPQHDTRRESEAGDKNDEVAIASTTSATSSSHWRSQSRAIDNLNGNPHVSGLGVQAKETQYSPPNMESIPSYSPSANSGSLSSHPWSNFRMFSKLENDRRVKVSSEHSTSTSTETGSLTGTAEKVDSGRDINTESTTEYRLPFSLRDVMHPKTSTHNPGTHSIDCKVDDWSQWSPCSQTCGFGHRERSRDVLTLPRNGGNNCPLFMQKEVCGSMRTCHWNHFSILGGQDTKRGAKDSRV